MYPVNYRSKAPIATNWTGVLNDLFGLDPNDKVESAHDSSSGIASDVASYYPQTNMSTFKGDNAGSDKTSEDSGRKSVSWASNLDSPRSSNHYVQMHINKQRQSPVTTATYKQKHISPRDKLVNKSVTIDLQDTTKLFLSSKGKHSRPSPFELLSDDIVLKILSYLPSDHLCRCSRVSRQWYEFVWEPFLWTKIVINNKNINVDKALKILTKRLGYNTPYVCVILERINLNGCEQLTDKGLQIIAKRCPELRHIGLQGCHNVTNAAVFELVSNCVNLEHFDLTGCSSVTCISLLEGAVSHGTPRHQQQIYLRYLDMTDCFSLDDEGLGIIAMHCSQLQFLYLRRCVRLTDESMQYLANYCSTLRELSVSDCRKITDLGLRDLSKLGDNLRYLSVAKCDRMSDVGVRYLAKFCSKLRYLNVRGCEGVSDESLELLSLNCPRMRSLDVGKCDITDEGLLVLSQNCPQLRKLSLKSCDSITDKGVVQLSYHCRGLQQLNIQDCNISVEGYKLVKRYCRRCIIEHTNPAFY
ncbi:hypothetical protein SNE40_010815 [Patella caerulea]|uniref:F-box domain-containing protein n=1 Tax=Patella caerulea TaxID=87958 RepID=A0AAN8JVT7_PATCE